MVELNQALLRSIKLGGLTQVNGLSVAGNLLREVDRAVLRGRERERRERHNLLEHRPHERTYLHLTTTIYQDPNSKPPNSHPSALIPLRNQRGLGGGIRGEAALGGDRASCGARDSVNSIRQAWRGSKPVASGRCGGGPRPGRAPAPGVV